MPLMQVDFDLVSQAQVEETARQLINYINTTLEPIVYILPSEPDYVHAFMPLATKDAYLRNHSFGQAFSFCILSNFLLGLEWMDDPLFQETNLKITQSHLDAASRWDYAMLQTIERRKQWEESIPQLHHLYINEINQSPTLEVNQFIQNYWYKACSILNIHSSKETNMLLHTYSNDFIAQEHIQVNRIIPKNYSPGELWARKNMGLSVTSNFSEFTHIDQMDQAHKEGLLTHLHFALCYGRFYQKNPLHQLLVKTLELEDHLMNKFRAIEFITIHQKRLSGRNHHG